MLKLNGPRVLATFNTLEVLSRKNPPVPEVELLDNDFLAG
jgi:hypothetical protein